MKLSPAQVSFIKSIGIVLIFSTLTYVGNADNLSGVVSMPIAALIAALASWLETQLKTGTSTALFGAVRTTSYTPS